MISRWIIAALVGWFLNPVFGQPAIGQDEDARDRPEPIEVVIPADKGRVVWKDVAGAVADTLSLDVATAEKIFPRGSMNLNSELVAVTMRGINFAARDKVLLDVVRDEDDQPAIRVRFNRKSLDHQQATEASIELDRHWHRKVKDRPLVICIHGLKSHPGIFDPMREYLGERGYATAAVAYDDQQAIADSAKQVSEVVDQAVAAAVAKHGIDPPEITIIGHSMGGLVGREWTENDAITSSAITQLITIATPHRGSALASLPALSDLVTRGDFNLKDVVAVIMHEPSSDSMRDLIPESDFLKTLNARPRRAHVRYTTIVGTGSPVNSIAATRFGNLLQKFDRRSEVFHLFRPRIEPLLGDLDEIRQGKGDGVVAVKNATIEGVDDVVRFKLSHIELVRRVSHRKVEPVYRAIHSRLLAP